MTDLINLAELLAADRSYRRFDHSYKIPEDLLLQLVELTTLCASGRNAQPLRYRIVSSEEECEKLFPHLAWAGYYKDWDGPAPEERPSAYLVQCLDTKYGANCLCDDGLQLQTITLGATAMHLGGCIIKAFNPQAVAETLNIPERYAPRYVLALGRPAETIYLEKMADEDADFKYYRTPDGAHHVPKRTLPQLIIR